MVSHLISLLIRAFMAIPGSLGSSWLGLIFPICVVIVGEIIAGFAFGWAVVRLNWKKATSLGFAALGVVYTLLFCWCIIATTYGDHVALNSHIGELHEKLQSTQAHESLAVQAVQTDLGGKLNDLKQSCAKTEGKNEALSQQASDQQGTINNCQTQAIKLLQPVAFQWHVMALEEAEISPTYRKQRWILLANKEVSPAEFIFNCSHPILEADAKIAGTVADEKTVRLDQDHWGSQIRSPAWGPNSPVLIILKIAATSNENTTCNFKLESVTK